MSRTLRGDDPGRMGAQAPGEPIYARSGDKIPYGAVGYLVAQKKRRL